MFTEAYNLSEYLNKVRHNKVYTQYHNDEANKHVSKNKIPLEFQT